MGDGEEAEEPGGVGGQAERIVKSRQWCEMTPCSEGEVCGLLYNRSGWTCTKGGGRIKTVTPLPKEPS
ncbi:hypothetical protein ANANG_G00227970 [Anguilla anguilla]|uniref:Uncharacterized protein n=1 Tax=Anguilla anguilla TaxID=7936 RepID=A0A9D3M1F5_ANGAN|nr:hypothetical protein ANANG_G00227970 [Anguilla anguilla]